MSGFTFDDLQDLDEGANDKPAPGGFDTLDDLDAQGFKTWHQPGDANSPTTTQPTPPEWSRPRYDPFRMGSDTAGAQMREAASDGTYSAAGGVLSGAGINPGQALGTNVANRLDEAQARSPTASGVGKFGGELGVQLAATPAKLGALLSGAVGGGLSAVGNTAGGLYDKAKAGLQGSAIGAGAGYAAGKLASLLGSAAEPLERAGNRQYLRQGGAATSDLNRLDRTVPGGAQAVAQSGRAQGIGDGFLAGPSGYQNDAQRAIESMDARRAVLSQGAPNLDPNALAASIRQGGAGHLPASTDGAAGALRSGVEREAAAAQQLGSPQNGVPWDEANKLRQFYGDRANFSNNPNVVDRTRMGMHGGVNDEMEQALSLQNPGAGEEWRGLGRSERDAMSIQDIGARAENRGGGVGLMDAGLAAAGYAGGGPGGGALSVLAGRAAKAAAPAMMKNAAFAGSNVAGGVGQLSPLLASASGTASGDYASKPLRVDQAALDLLGGGSKGAELGQWRDQIAQAAGSPDTGAVQATITRLTMSDPEFRIKILPLLRQQAGGQM